MCEKLKDKRKINLSSVHLLLFISSGLILTVYCSGCRVISQSIAEPTPGKSSGMVCFSEDSSKVVFIWQEYWCDISMNQNLMKRNEYLYWCDVRNVGKLKHVKVGSQGKEAARWGYSVVSSFSSSPNAKYAAVEFQGKLSMVDLETGKTMKLPLEGRIDVKGYIWLNDREIAYGRWYEDEAWRYLVYNVEQDRKKIVPVKEAFWYPQERQGPRNLLPSIAWVDREQGDRLRENAQKQGFFHGAKHLSFFKAPIASWVGMREILPTHKEQFYALKIGGSDEILKKVRIGNLVTHVNTFAISPDGRWFATVENSFLTGPKVRVYEINIPVNENVY
ncbi:MAG: hypothetical protein K9M75_08180 [Phycisphaerae bacterium]|nr:hypothetical protein [Phycisphaerae bacterium]